eukprot:Protomagalhaensia_sp_Gyna_25__5138@NODE_5_length_9194_cov_16_563845_g4_i0_p3_GENE_NODE_5_length_9194_cov_16_563845_g4_i0NODE_5_length_9194_cov_16_563845_g4_i0_p3_ORF_typecomplete_len690_score100_02CPSase_L_D2/PF02786_17/5_1e58Biotin_carb_C/PF02785_19/9_3e03Biotin_carb_C/PF02785_19/4_9e23Biotin_carb_N/PF00289_22/7e23ATPgrasp_3/PF02655_14/6_6e16ATPgrasp/PF02222_22/8_3e10Dala_Dala_lig_C/PF07478_13/1_2e09ATPgrasp_Ter/PF15632_6/5_9e09ATPgrasp_4/PF13535_6/6e08RimK/PF08443_11/1_5e05RimK/PF08443_11/3_2e
MATHPIEVFCQQHGGNRPLFRLLIANNGNAAIKAINSLRQWCLTNFQNEQVLTIVGMATQEDKTSNSKYIAHCDHLETVRDGTNNYNYANVETIKEAAEHWDCDAVWPGWGHASENPALPRTLASVAKPIIWVGPSPEAMEALGCKIGSTIIAQSVGVPVVPWSGSHVRVQQDENRLYRITPEHKAAACLPSWESLRDMLSKGTLELPLMLKAATGGGGKGIRIVRSVDQVEEAFRQVTGEVKGSDIFAMRLVTRCRHLEVQILGDMYGNVTSLGCRDCTIQRRHQKIIEEGPPTVCDQQILDSMEAAAVALCEAVGYYNAGTVEFLYDPDQNKFYFLEVNARLQVEHVVTEMLTDVNLPAAQIQVAMGIPLDRIQDVANYRERRKHMARLTDGPHCIAARITAEDPEKDFQPTCGRVDQLAFESSRVVWGYFSLGTASRVSAYADNQFGHLFATCRTREAARTALRFALDRLHVQGEICTNIHALQEILKNDDFINNRTYTTWVQEQLSFGQPPEYNLLCAVLFAAVCKASQKFSEDDEGFIASVQQGQVARDPEVSCNCEFVYRDRTKFVLTCYRIGPSEIRVEMNGSSADCEFTSNHNYAGLGSSYFINKGLDGKHRQVSFREDTHQDNLKVSFDSMTFTFCKERDPTLVSNAASHTDIVIHSDSVSTSRQVGAMDDPVWSRGGAW